MTFASAAIAQLGERQTEDLKVPGSIPGLGTFLAPTENCAFNFQEFDSAHASEPCMLALFESWQFPLNQNQVQSLNVCPKVALRLA